MAMLFAWAGYLFAGLALLGAAYALMAAVLAARFMRDERPAMSVYPPVTILKPLYLGEPGLSENLESFFAQDYPAKIQIVFGVHDEKDPAAEVVRKLQARYPHLDTVIVADGAQHGSNGKVSNLTFGGPNFDLLVCTCGDRVYARKVKVKGANGWDAPNKPANPRL